MSMSHSKYKHFCSLDYLQLFDSDCKQLLLHLNNFEAQNIRYERQADLKKLILNSSHLKVLKLGDNLIRYSVLWRCASVAVVDNSQP